MPMSTAIILLATYGLPFAVLAAAVWNTITTHRALTDLENRK